jgi:hypothetical protein
VKDRTQESRNWSWNLRGVRLTTVEGFVMPVHETGDGDGVQVGSGVGLLFPAMGCPEPGSGTEFPVQYLWNKVAITGPKFRVVSARANM